MRSPVATSWNAALIEEYYERWQQDPASVDGSWKAFFEGFELGLSSSPPGGGDGEATNGAAHPQPGRNGAAGLLAAGRTDAGRESAPPDAAGRSGASADGAGAAADRSARVEQLVHAYRELGHTQAHLDPLGSTRPAQPQLALDAFGLEEADLDQPVRCPDFAGGETMTLRALVERLRQIYCGTIGAEFVAISDRTVRGWVQERFESRAGQAPLGPADQRRVLRHLLDAETFERFLHTRYVGQKRFSLEGGESLMVALEFLLERGAAAGVREIVMGMAHRGRLNVLANFLKKSLRTIFTEFSENYVPQLTNGDGDVKYHLGYEAHRKAAGDRDVFVQMASNPSHLEIVAPVVLGKARARQRILEDTRERRRVLPLIIHGDAAFIGQGVVAETFNLSQLAGYRTGGTIHLVVNNQIGFTTLPADARSTPYCTDIARMVEAPVFHVNGDDPEAVVFCTELALDFRQRFGRDVVVDVYCYRRYGHNEGDEPSFTQPNLYAQIARQPSTATIYSRRLVEAGRLTAADAEQIHDEFEKACEEALAEVRALDQAAKTRPADARQSFDGSKAVFQPPYSHEPVPTAIAQARLEEIVHAVTRVPEGFRILPKIRRNLLERRLEILEKGGPYDWALAETLAFGSLLLEGKPVRLSGQDSRRGTFSQRQSVFYDAETRERYIPLNHLAENQPATFCVYNSPLSEAAVLGFDYGYSQDYPEMLCLWEAQFGDFSNGAQVIIDQFIASAESKWQRPSGIVLLLPHGYEGQGPEHSSARLERFLQLCAEDNLQVANVTTPAQYFHLLRRQVTRSLRKPLVVMTPKSLLRNERAVSRAEEFVGDTRFQEIIETPPTSGRRERAERVVFCSGKVFYDLRAGIEERGLDGVALVRVEQLYPLHGEALGQVLTAYRATKKVVWCQEEPQNMGAWSFVSAQLLPMLGRLPLYAGRDASASPAVGAKKLHDLEQRALVEQALTM